MTDLTAELAPGAVLVECSEPGCDHSIAAFGGRVEHHGDGSHSFHYDRRPLIIGGTFVTVPIPNDAARIIVDYLISGTEQLDERLAPFGLRVSDIAQPTFERLAYVDEVAR